ncbi:UDP-N-acetylmuramoyl-L-alanine--D-glutamate ligase [Enterococcus villorum]|uniref:UDP-N-acetylmuramoylalanine--D-glutamate ligase n=2 Tax=Enterococcus villorum TaxID=112904 RepID=A0A511IZG1_9ENTE|nr:UDP-N-acetylmuramoylalanine-D-glutamate ligase [Enterococcus villorum ATCC 700913]EOW76108.1 UDP-N-acetylmuramoylalanine-D-glutamate ligase [Enterococcus villorum ATCC 700913]GEL91162.1 UDP-N-acetylmuramoylalanine--D-glutamate ligase [Enterococcus villorum]
MKKISTYENKKVLVLGLAKSGFSAAKLLHELGALVTVNDGKPFNENPEAQELLSLGVKVIAGSHPIELLDEEFSLMVKNPGIPYNHPFVVKAQELDIPVITEVELAYEVAECPIIGITGTNGKTTTTTMTGLLLNAGDFPGTARLAGNIGYPASSVAQEAMVDDLMVMELSSFQLMGISEFHPHVAVITNIYEAHIDYHKTREEYVKAKWHLQQNMTEADYLILNWNQEELKKLSEKTKATVLPFATQQKLEKGAYSLDGSIFYDQEKIMEIAELGVPGAHNVENALAAISVAKLYGVSNETIKETLHLFRGVPHRTQYVGEIKGRKFYNDSKATNILATKMALSGFSLDKLILIAGGLDRGLSFDELIPSLKGIKALVAFGETKEKLVDVANQAGIPVVTTAENAELAVPIAFDLSEEGDAILLSPANASWDQYPNFEIRGERFMEAVKKLK